jgi:hypothetical protein
MSKRLRVFGYILINVVISAATVLVVLWIWEQSHPTPGLDQKTANIPPVENTPSQVDNETKIEISQNPEDDIDFVKDEAQASIHAIVGPGNLAVEYVEIHNQSQGPIDMTGWQLTDQEENSFVFPALILNENGAIKVLSKKGNNTVIELYWQSEFPIWQSGETATLLNAQGETLATYSIP